MLNIQTHDNSRAVTGRYSRSNVLPWVGERLVLGAGATRMTFAARKTLYLEGDPADHVFIIRSGTVKVYKFLADGRCQITGFLFPGDFFGLHRNGRYIYSVEGVTEIRVEALARRRLDAAFESDPGLQRRFVTALANELVTAQEQLLLLGRRSAPEKLAWFLLMLNGRYAKPGGSNLIHLPMRGLDIADYLGLAAETVSRTLSQFKREGKVRTVASRTLQLADRDALESIVYGRAHSSRIGTQ